MAERLLCHCWKLAWPGLEGIAETPDQTKRPFHTYAARRGSVCSDPQQDMELVSSPR